MPKHKLEYQKDTDNFIFEELDHPPQRSQIKLQGKEDERFAKTEGVYGLLVFDAKKQNFTLLEVS